MTLPIRVLIQLPPMELEFPTLNAAQGFSALLESLKPRLIEEAKPESEPLSLERVIDLLPREVDKQAFSAISRAGERGLTTASLAAELSMSPQGTGALAAAFRRVAQKLQVAERDVIRRQRDSKAGTTWSTPLRIPAPRLTE